jgi:sporulation protein YlmC with PRC-barrel domain
MDMRLKQLRGLPVIDPVTARKIGNVLDYQIDPVSGQVAAIDVGHVTAEDSDAQRILAQRIRRVGRSAVILTGTGSGESILPPTIEDRWLDAASLVGLEVMGDDGNNIGRLVDAAFNQDTLSIDFYLLRLGVLERLIPRRGRIVPSRIQSCSRELMLLSTGGVAALPVASTEEATPSLPVPLKVDDRLPAPSFEQVPEGQPAVAQTS